MEHFKFNRDVFSVVKMEDSDKLDLEFWLTKTPQERMAALEYIRQVAFGYDPATSRISRVFEVIEQE